MAEELKVRVVRCPKCENLLPELPHYSVYQCGGCGTVLEAKKNALILDDLSLRSIEKNEMVVSEKLDSITNGYDLVSLVDVPITEIGYDKIDLHEKEHHVFEETDVSSIVNPLITQNQEAFDESDRYKGKEPVDTQLVERITDDKEAGLGNKREKSSNSPVGSPVLGDGNEVNLDRINLSDLRIKNEPKKITNPNSSLRSREIKYLQDMERGVNPKDPQEHRKFSANVFPNERPFKYHPDYVHARDDHMNNHEYINIPQKVENLERDRAELRRKLDELKDELIRSHNVAAKPKEVYDDRRMIPPNPLFNRSHGPVPYLNVHDEDMHNFYPPPRQAPIDICYEDSLRPQITWRNHHHSSSSSSQDRLASSYNSYRNWQGPSQNAYSDFQNRRFHHGTSSNFNHDADFDPINRGPCYNPRDIHRLHSHSQYSQPYKRSQGDFDSNFPSRTYYPPRRVLISHRRKQICRPLAGGAPFLTCCNCSQLLKMPRKIMLMEKNMRKLKCGACETIIMFEEQNKGLVVCYPTPTDSIHVEINHNPSVVLNDDSPDFGISSFKSESTDTEANFLPTNEHDDCYDSSSSISSEEKLSQNSEIIHNDASSLRQASLKDNISPPFSQSPIKNIRSNHEAESRYENGNKSNRLNQDNVTLDKSSSQHIVANEIEDTVKEDHSLKIHKGSRSFLGSFIKKGFKDFSRSSQRVDTVRSTSNVSVNGQSIPYRIVEKAAKLAGPIQPGKYWYDFRAGFWGVMGQPCHGIIPPFIEEFNYPMPEKCGAGNTEVYVNGRELYQKDLDLLVRRGLPSTRNKYYIVEISGMVIDEETGQELDNLGRLAPTVEKNGKGFGMRVPQVIQ